MKNLFLTVMFFTGNLLLYSQFTCDSSIYLGQTPNIDSNTTLYRVDTSTNPFTYPAIGSIAAVKYNAMGFHPSDGYIYAMSDSSNNILRINSDGTYVNLGAVTNLPTGVRFNAGEIDNSGNFYVAGMGTVNTIYKINLTTLTATAIPLQSTITVSDFAFNPINNTLYGVHNSAGILTRINPANGAVVFIGTASAGAPFGAMVGSSTGAIYGVSNNGGFYQFNITNGSRVLISGSPSSQGNDGAHCVTSPISFGADLSITKNNGTTTYTPGTTTTYTIVARNNGPFGVLNASVVDNVPAGIPNSNMSYTAITSSGSTTTVTGTQTGAINDLVSLPVNGTVTYTVMVNIPATFTGNLSNKATITSPVTSNDPDLSNNTATDTDVLPSCLSGPDSDGDGIPDLCDLDADNDGIPNCVENGFDGDPNSAFKTNADAIAFSNPPGSAPLNQFRLTNGSGQRGQAWSYGRIDFANNFTLTMKVLLSDADGIAMVFQNDPLGTAATGIHGQGLGARGIQNGIALELDTFANSCTNDNDNGGNCDPDYDHGSIRTTVGTATSGWIKLAGDGQLGDGNVNDGLWHTVVVTWNAASRILSYTFDGTLVTNYTFPTTGVNSLETIFDGTTQVRFGFTGSTGEFGGNNSIGFDNTCEIPLYFDTDDDGIPDYLDLDSDNDGCYDALEGDGSYIDADLNPDGSINVTTYPVDGNGIPDNGNSQGIGQSQNSSIADCDCPGSGIDSDGDGIPDMCELDADNDGILNVNECYGEKVNNGSFTSNSTGWTLEGGWTYFANQVQNQNDTATNDVLSQALNPLSTQLYKLTFSLGASDFNNTIDTRTASLAIKLGGVTYAVINNATGTNNNVTIALNNGALSDFTPFSTSSSRVNRDVTIYIPYNYSTSQLNTLEFIMESSGDDWYLDNISLSGGCDSDGDGIPDYLDLDSDNDGCPDAIEGDGNLTPSQLNPDGSINITANGGIDADGVPVLASGGQGIGESQNVAVNSCPTTCTKPGAEGTPLTSNVGILTKLSATTGWPENVPNGYIVLDSSEKGFVITHMTTAQRDLLTPVEGMMIYNTTLSCVQLYRGTSPTVDSGRTGWNCIEQGCGDLP